MNINNLNNLTIFFLISFWIGTTTFAQVVNLPGLPVIRNYLPKEYKAHNQNWAITVDNRGMMYFGNSAGVLEFDGYNWSLIGVPNGIVRSLDVDDKGTVFVGSADDLGFLEIQTNGTLTFKSFLPYLEIDEAIGHVWYTYFINGSIFFVTHSRIFQFDFKDHNYKKPDVTLWLPKKRFKVAHKYENKLYVVDAQDGLSLFTGNGFEKVIGGEIFADDNIYSMLPYNNDGSEILIASKSKGLFIYNGKSFRSFKTESDDFIIHNRLYMPGAKLSDDTFVLNTTTSGIIFIDKSGKTQRIINMNTGLPDDGVIYVASIHNKLWLATQNGISAIDVPSPITYLDQSSGLKGSVNDVRVFNHDLYAATTDGLFQFDLNHISAEKSKFKKITNQSQEGWHLCQYKNALLAAMTDAVLLIENSDYKTIKSSWRGCYFLYHSKIFENRIYVGLEDGLAILEESQNRWIDRGKIEGISTAIRNISEDDHGNLWLGTPYSGVIRVSNFTSDLDTTPEIKQYFNNGDRNSVEVKIFSTHLGLLFSTENNVFNFDYNEQKFEAEKRFGIMNHFPNGEMIYIHEDQEQRLWVSTLNKSSELAISVGEPDVNGKYSWKDLSLLKNVLDFSNRNAVFSIYKDENSGIVWFCGADGIVSFDSKYLINLSWEQEPFNTIISKVTINGDSLLFHGDDLTRLKYFPEGEMKLNSDVNSIRFNFSSLTFDNHLSTFQFKLEGFDNEWSTWTIEDKKDYTNLPTGNYVFRVRAKDIYENISEESTFAFYILSPWYFSWYAFLIYSIFLAFLIYLIVQLRVKYLIKRNIKLESIITDRTKVISEQAEQLKELDDIKSRFFTNISHEFRTPLTITLGQVESVMNSLQDFNLKKKLEMGYQNARKLLRLINQLLEISKIESGKQKLFLVKKDIVSFVRHILYTFESIADQKGISLEINSTHNEIELYFDFEKMDKVFTNLISNAIKFTNDGGKIKVQISLTKENSLEEKDTVEIIIEDTGIGIPEDRLPYIFDRFYQADRVDKSDIEGTGIGLTLTKELIEVHSGKIEVESKPGSGTKFKVILLLGKDHYKAEEISAEKKENGSESLIPELQIEDSDIEKDSDQIIGSFVKESVLVVDDNSDIRQFIREQLEETYTIFEAKDGLSGIKTAKESIPNLIITDVRMPGMDGFELSKKLKEDTLTSHIPIIILTAKSDHSDKLTGLKTGADDYLVKPFSTQELAVRVKNLISIRKNLREKYSKTANFNPSEVTESSLDQKFLTKVVEEINNNISDEKFNAEILAENCAISVSQLNRKLNALIGQPAGHFIRSVRMEKAANMIINNEASIKEAAYFVGYSDQSNFARSFKKHFGKTPGEFISDHAHN
jgi:signal transduction histidine kinase/DNA-binding response OmpR family regulator